MSASKTVTRIHCASIDLQLCVQLPLGPVSGKPSSVAAAGEGGESTSLPPPPSAHVKRKRMRKRRGIRQVAGLVGDYRYIIQYKYVRNVTYIFFTVMADFLPIYGSFSEVILSNTSKKHILVHPATIFLVVTLQLHVKHL
jgi:hypothetical protein